MGKGIQGFVKSIKGHFDEDYQKDKAVAQEHAGIPLPYDAFEKLRESGATLSKAFNPGVIMAEYTHSGTIHKDVDPKEDLKRDILAHVEQHTEILSND